MRKTDSLPSSDFLVPGPGPYLASHSVGCQPRAVAARLQQELLAPWGEMGGDAWPAWLAVIDGFRRELAELFSVAADEICPQPTVSAALFSILSALPRRDGRRHVWLTSAQTFPSLGFVLQRARELGHDVRWIDAARDPSDPATWLDALSDDVTAVLMMHVHSNTGAVAPVRVVAEACRRRGIVTVLDVAQSAGILPVKLRALDVDFAIGSCGKWLCGGSGAAFLWSRSEQIERLEPPNVGWFSHADPFEMDIGSFRYAPTAARFWGGTPGIAPYVIAGAGVRAINAVGVEPLLAHNRHLIGSFFAELRGTDVATVDLARNGGTLCLDAGDRLESVQRALAAAGVRFDARGRRIRLSFHLYNSRQDAEIAGRAWHSAIT